MYYNLFIGIFQIDQINDESSGTQSFRNLKKSIKRHFSVSHSSHFLIDSNLKDRPDLVNEKAAALRCANICYNIYKHGRPYTDYPDQVALYCKAGIWMGNTNHSRKFPEKFINSVGQAVSNKIK